ncbi:ABC transporter permease, partial [Pseudomonas viridiflava]
FDPNAQNIQDRLLPPSDIHWLGTDAFGRDLFTRLLHGTRPTLLLVSLVLLLTLPIGVLVGVTAGFYGGWTERILMRLTDVIMAFPQLVLALAFVAILGPGLLNGALALSLTAWPAYA